LLFKNSLPDGRQGERMKNKVIFQMILVFGFIWLSPSPQAQAARVQQPPGTVFIKRIVVSGFVLSDKPSFLKIIKANQKKFLSQEQIQQIMDQIKALYLEAGYSELVDISYKIEKENLLITILLLSR
jgi:hypothetical protein